MDFGVMEPPSRERVQGIVQQTMFGGRTPQTQTEFNAMMDATKAIYTAVDKPIRNNDPRMGFVGKMIGGGAQAGGASELLMGALQQMQQGMKNAGIDIGKEINFDDFTDAIPSQLGFNVFDLRGPARITAPFMAPLRERVPRTNGEGPAALYKIITGFSGSMTGGVGALNPAFSLEVPNAGANVEAARGNPVEYAQANGITAYTFNAIRDAVTFTAFFSGQGFQDLRAMSAALGMQISLMGEEREILMGRDEVLAAVDGTSIAGTARAVVTAGAWGTEVGIVGTGGAGTDVSIKVTAIGPFGETAASAASTVVNIAIGVTRVIDFTWDDVDGALGYNVYVGYGDNAAAITAWHLDYIVGAQQSTGYNKFTVGAFGRRTTGATPPAADTGTGSALNYRGMIQSIEEGPALGTSITGQSGRLNAQQAGQSMDWMQQLFADMWQDAKGDPEEVWMNSREIKNGSALILQGDSTNYRVTFAPGEANGIVAGAMVSSVINESTRRLVNLKTHPWLPFGNAVGLSYQLPFATAFGQSNIWEVKGPQDLMQVQWPLTTLRWEWTNLWMNALVLFAPTFNFVEHGIAQSSDVADGFLC